MNELIKNFEQWMFYAYIAYDRENPCEITNRHIFPVIEYIYHTQGNVFENFYFTTYFREDKVLFYFNPEILLKMKILKCCIPKEEINKLSREFFEKTCGLFKEIPKK